MYLINDITNSLYDRGRNTCEYEHRIAHCFDEDNTQKEIPSHYNRAIYLFERINGGINLYNNTERDIFQSSSPQNNFDCVGMGTSNKSVRYTERVAPRVSTTRVEDFNNI